MHLTCCTPARPEHLVLIALCSIHPADPGHQVLAELLAGALSQAVWEVSANGTLTESERRHDPAVPALPGPMIPFNTDDMPGMCAMLVSTHHHALRWQRGGTALMRHLQLDGGPQQWHVVRAA